MRMTPALGHGKICYVVIPAVDVAKSAAFYEQVFGWRIRRRGDGQIAFDDGVGEVSGTWDPRRAPIDAGTFLYIMTDDARRTCASVIEHGGDVVEPVDPDATEIIAQFRDPGGNIFGLYQEPSLESR
jgi:predicted enzyme related to lactoylglutathione lyase